MSKISIKHKIIHSIKKKIRNYFQKLRILFYKIISTNTYSGKIRLHQPLLVLGDGNVSFQGNVALGVNPSPLLYSTYAHIEARNPGSTIIINDSTWINNNFVAIAEHTSISIGKNCLIGYNVAIYDSDFHGHKSEERRSSKPEWAAPVEIGNNVFIGSNVTILKGVHIGENTIIANGSIVTKSIPENYIAAGNPARLVRKID